MPKGYGEGSKATRFRKGVTSIDDRFDASYIPEPNSGCWLWEKDCDNKGYGRIWDGAKSPLAHRVSYKRFVRDPGKKFVLHKCDTPCCVNPMHLYDGSQQDNVNDQIVRNRRVVSWGEDHGHAKVTKEQVLQIRVDPRPQKVIAKEYGLSQSSVSLIKTKKNWRRL